MVTNTLSALAYESVDMNQKMLWGALLMAVIVGSMRTTRRATLQLLSITAGELWWNMWTYSPHRLLAAGLRKALPLPPGVIRKIRGGIKSAGRVMLGRYALVAFPASSAASWSSRYFRRKGSKPQQVLHHRHKSLVGHHHYYHYHSHHHHHHNRHHSRRINGTISLYRRMPLKSISRLWGKFNQVDLPVFLRRPLIGLYVWLFGCDLQEALESDLRSYRNLGEFFRRQLRHDVRPVDETHNLTSPSDGKVLYHGQVKNGILEQVKGVTYSLRGFLGPQTWPWGADQTEQSLTHTGQDLTHQAGQDLTHQSDDAYQSSLRLRPGNELYHCIIYLAPGDYHRFHSPTTWTVTHRRHFPGELLSVNPGVARWIQGLFNFNERAVYTGQWEHGFFSMSAVGATNVGSIKIYCDEELETNIHPKQPQNTFFDKPFAEPVTVHKGDMFGEFNLGSTIVLIFEAPRGFQFKVKEGEKIKFGRPLGRTP